MVHISRWLLLSQNLSLAYRSTWRIPQAPFLSTLLLIPSAGNCDFMSSEWQLSIKCHSKPLLCILWLFYSFCPLFCNVSWTWKKGASISSLLLSHQLSLVSNVIYNRYHVKPWNFFLYTQKILFKLRLYGINTHI